MNGVFSIVMIFGLGILLITAPDSVLPSLLSGGKDGLVFAGTLFAGYAVWLSVLKMLESMKFNLWLGGKMKPLLHRLFPDETDPCYGALSVNLSANLLGMGSAATPAGISAMEQMKLKKNRTMLLVINSCSIQLIPTTIIAMRSSLGSTTDIILPSIIATVASAIFGIILVKVFVK